MGKAQHTPGPWIIRDALHTPRREIVSDDQRIAVIGESSITEGSPRANACLIAAAPDLLAAMRALLEATVDLVAVHDAEGTWTSCIDEAKAVIAKAEGGEHD